MALGSSGRAVFVIQNASLMRQGDTITGTFEVQLDIYTGQQCARGLCAGQRVGQLHRRHR